MSNSRVHELAHAIRYADATLSPDDINHWIADALDLLNSGRAGGSSRVYTLPAAFPNRKLTRELERRLEGVENLAAAAIRERDEARAEVARVRAFNGDLGATPTSVLRESTRLLSSAMAENRRLMGEVERLQAVIDGLPAMVREQADFILIADNIDRPISETPWLAEHRYGNGEYDARWYPVRDLQSRVIERIWQAQARVSTPVREERGE